MYKQDSKNEDEEYFNLAEDKTGFLWEVGQGWTVSIQTLVNSLSTRTNGMTPDL